MIIMTILKIIFVIMLCIPLGYIALKLVVQLNNQVAKSTKKKGRSGR
ncbi:MAG: hypothetical protein RR661_06930 [Anaerovoracaceae bacterium]